MTVVCIAGMHRSGTSLVARALNLAGLYLGAESDLWTARPDNPEGYWENIYFGRINDALLAEFGGGWDLPPVFPTGWLAGSRVLPHRAAAMELIGTFGASESWGWKDPRNSLTIEFWRDLLPDLKVVICLRNPLEVVQSLMARGFASPLFGLGLWVDYNRRLLETVPAERRLITHYVSYFKEPHSELQRVLDFLGLRASQEQLGAAVSACNHPLRHNRSTLLDLLATRPPFEVIDLYQAMCAEAGPAYPLAVAADPVAPPLSKADYDEFVERFQKERQKENLLQREHTVQALTLQVGEKGREVLELSNQLADTRREVQELANQLAISQLRLQGGLAMRLITAYGQRLAVVFPSGSLVRRACGKCLRAVRMLITHGPGAVVRAIFRRPRIKPALRGLVGATGAARHHPAPSVLNQDAKATDYVSLREGALAPEQALVKPIAFYLPQYHPIPENDEWWGRGFTDWTNVAKAVPQFVGHYQPHLPGELGFYDLRVPEVQHRQVELAKQYGIYGFCFYYYWFAGKRLLERPLDLFLRDSALDFPFCLCWANENWTRRWDGAEHEVLIRQIHTESEYVHFIRDIAPNFSDPRYIRVEGKPMLLVYRADILPNPKGAVETWRSECRQMGVEDIYLVAAQSFGTSDPRPYGFDAAVEFPPHYLGQGDLSPSEFKMINTKFTGRLLDYGVAARVMMQNRPQGFTLFKTVMPGWDNTPRKPDAAHVFVNSSPSLYRDWLRNVVTYTTQSLPEDRRFVFINAWNEWAEGAHLEPDRHYGYAFLEATAQAIVPQPVDSSWTILFVAHDAFAAGAQIVLLNTLAWLKAHTALRLKLLCLHGGELLPAYREIAETLVLDELPARSSQHDRSLRQMVVDFCGGVPDLVYGNTVASGRAYSWLKQLGAPILTHFHELESSIDHYAADCIENVLKDSKHFIACSGAVRDNLIRSHGVPPEKISTVYSSISAGEPPDPPDDDEKRRIKRTLGLDPNKLLIFGCGKGMPFRKGADLFIDLAGILHRQGLDNFHMYWMGDFELPYADGTYREDWLTHINRLQASSLNSSVTFLGTVDSPREYLRAGDLFVLTSREEPFGLVVLEAADCGVPSICFENAGAADFVGTDAGYVVPTQDLETMALKVAALLKDEHLRTTMGARARDKLLSSFTVERITPRTLSICRQVARRPPTVSVVVPNYNHARYLPQRLESIFGQSFQDFEVIVLDDASTDNSLEVLQPYRGRGDLRIVRNEVNGGTPFKQWLRGLDLARADIVWIAESDDSCDPEFLRTLLPAFKDPAVKLAYANSNIIDEQGNIVGDYLESPYLTSLSTTKWRSSYKVPAGREINDGLGVKDTILNASGVLFRRTALNKSFRETFSGMRIAGDWYFVVNAIKGGSVQYVASKLNYHRRHPGSVIGRILQEKKIDGFFQEFCLVQRFVFRSYELEPDFERKWEHYLRQQWQEFFPGRSFEDLKSYYPFDEMKALLFSSNPPTQ